MFVGIRSGNHLPKELAMEQEPPVQDLCLFCKTDANDIVKFGHMIQHDDVTVHYFCMLFASGLCQNGECETDGIKGFLTKDVKLEVSRGKRLKCIYCEEKGATVGCVVVKCRKVFHYPCGYDNGMLNQYFGSFQSFCEEHRPTQAVPMRDRLAFKGTANTTCLICMCNVEARASNSTLRAPCCKNSWFHRACIQRMATCSGVHFFKCPLCNNKEIFQNEMLEHGIYIPDQDAAWELEPNAFQELLQRHCRCDVKTCQSIKGRQYNKDNSKWEIMLCDWCGSQGTHLTCSSLKTPMDDWVCADCQKIVGKNFRKKAKKKIMSPEEKALPKEWLEFKNKSEYPGKTKAMRKTKKQLNFSTIKLKPGQKLYPGISDVRVVLKDLKLKQDKKVAKETKRRSSIPAAATCTVTSSSAVTDESSPDKKRRKLQRVNGNSEEMGPVDLTNRPNWYKELMAEDIITGANLGRQLSSFPKELSITKSMELETNLNEACADVRMNENAESADCEIAFSKPVINERRRWLQEQTDDTTYDIDLSSKPRWYQELMSTDIITGKNLGANFAEVHEKLDVVQSSSPQISPLKSVQLKVTQNKDDDMPPPLQTEVTPLPVLHGRKASRYCQRDGSSFSPSLVPDNVAKKGRELKALLREDIVTGNNLGAKFSDLHTSLLPIPILSPVKPSEQEIPTREVNLADSCPPKLKRFDEPDTDSSSEPENALDKSSFMEDFRETNLSKDAQETSLNKDVGEENGNSEIKPFSGNRFYRKPIPKTSPKKKKTESVVEKTVKKKGVDIQKGVGKDSDSVKSDFQEAQTKHQESSRRDRNIFSQIEKEFLPLEDLMFIGEEAGCDFLHENIQPIAVNESEPPQAQHYSPFELCNVDGRGKHNFRSSLTGGQMLVPEDPGQIFTSDAPTKLDSDSIGSSSLESETLIDIQLTARKNEQAGQSMETKDDTEPEVMSKYSESQVDIDKSVLPKRKPGRPKQKGMPKTKRIHSHAMKTRFSGFNFLPKLKLHKKGKTQPGHGKRGRPSKPISQEEELLARELQAKHEFKIKHIGRPVVHGKFSIFSSANEKFRARYFKYAAMRKLQRDMKRKAKENKQEKDNLENKSVSSTGESVEELPERFIEELKETVKEEPLERPIKGLEESVKEEPLRRRRRKVKPLRIKLKSQQNLQTGTVKKMGRPVVHGKYSIFNGDVNFREKYFKYAAVRKAHRELKRKTKKSQQECICEELKEKKPGRPRRCYIHHNTQGLCEEKNQSCEIDIEGNEEEAIKKKPGRPRKYSVEQNAKDLCEGKGLLSEKEKDTEGHHEESTKKKPGRPRKCSLEQYTNTDPNASQNQPNENEMETNEDNQSLTQKKPGRARKHSSNKNIKGDINVQEKDITSPASNQKENLVSAKKQIKITSFFNQSPESTSPPVLHERRDCSFNIADSPTKSQPEYIDLEDLFDISPLKSPQRFSGIQNEETFEQKSLKVEKECMKQLYSDVAINSPSQAVECNTQTVQKKLTSFVNVYKKNEGNLSLENLNEHPVSKDPHQDTSNASNHDEGRPIAMISPMKIKEDHFSGHVASPKTKKHSIMQHAKNFFFNKLVTGFNTKESSEETDTPISELERNNNVQHIRIQEGLIVLKDD